MVTELLCSWPVGPPASAAFLSVARPVARDAVFSSRRALEARGGFLTVAPPWGPRDALLCPSCAPWRAARALPVPWRRAVPRVLPVSSRSAPGVPPRCQSFGVVCPTPPPPPSPTAAAAAEGGGCVGVDGVVLGGGV
ncbi:unnamed protein product [Closterium sp. NIES-53]